MHSHDHSHSHSGHCHCSVPTTPAQVRALRIALVLVASFSMAELWVSLQSNSLSLMADAGHMVCGCVCDRPFSVDGGSKDTRPSGGVDDAQRLNASRGADEWGMLLLVVCAWLGWEAVGELLDRRRPKSLSLARGDDGGCGLYANQWVERLSAA